jgi:hypothetical protein
MRFNPLGSRKQDSQVAGLMRRLYACGWVCMRAPGCVVAAPKRRATTFRFHPRPCSPRLRAWRRPAPRPLHAVRSHHVLAEEEAQRTRQHSLSVSLLKAIQRRVHRTLVARHAASQHRSVSSRAVGRRHLCRELECPRCELWCQQQHCFSRERSHPTGQQQSRQWRKRAARVTWRA